MALQEFNPPNWLVAVVVLTVIGLLMLVGFALGCYLLGNCP
jgi:hypothetical protein